MRHTRCAALFAAFMLMSLAGSAARAAATRYSADALYNLGNSYARAGKPGLAVLNYERASLLAPGDPDIAANLSFVRRAAKLPSPPPTPFERSVELVSPTTLAWTGVAGLSLAGGCLLIGRRPRHRGWRAAGIAIGIALAAVTVCNGIALWPTLHSAVILNDATPVRVAPVPMGDPLFTLREAETVRISDRHEGFVLIQTAAGKTGWVAGANLAPVVPAP